jgi:hypothetical protein
LFFLNNQNPGISRQTLYKNIDIINGFK